MSQGLGFVYDQDTDNLAMQYKGFQTSRKRGETLGNYQEARIRRIHMTLDRYLNEPFEEVITVCDAAAEACPFFPGAVHRRHWSLEDPSKAMGSEAEQLAVYRRVRDELRSRIEKELLADRH